MSLLPDPDSKTSMFKSDISLGNVLTIVAMTVAVAMGWQALSSAVAEMDRKVLRVEQKADKIEGESERLRDKVESRELATQRSVTEIQTDLRYVRQSLDYLVRQNGGGRVNPQ
jgi:hypothetical protein